MDLATPQAPVCNTEPLSLSSLFVSKLTHPAKVIAWAWGVSRVVDALEQLGIKRVYPHVWPAFFADARIVHYTGTKPWEWHETPDMPLERAQWWTQWDAMEAERVRGGLPSLGALGREPGTK